MIARRTLPKGPWKIEERTDTPIFEPLDSKMSRKSVNAQRTESKCHGKIGVLAHIPLIMHRNVSCPAV